MNLLIRQVEDDKIRRDRGQITNTDVRIFGKPSLRVNRRMGVALSYGPEPVEKLIEKAKAVSSQIKFSWFLIRLIYPITILFN